MDRLEAMSMLVAVVGKGSFSAASRDLRVPLATLSRKISDLEAHLGARLLTRTTRRITLTDAGATYVAAARRILDQVEEAEQEAANEFTMPRGELILTTPIMFGRLHVLPVVSAFLAALPEINVRLILADRNLHLVEDHVDMAVRIGELPDGAMVATRIGVMRTVTCASPACIARHGRPATPDDLLGMPCVSFDFPGLSPVWRYRLSQPPRASRASEAANIAIRPRLSVTTAEAAVEAAILGTGVTRLLHYQVATAVESGLLEIVLQDFELPPSPVHVVHVARGQMPLKMRRFLDFAVPRLRQTLAAQGIGGQARA